MNQGLSHPAGDTGEPSGTSGPYQRLGLEPGASFEAVQAARDARLAELDAEDSLARSAIEAAYDAVLMERLKERQQGKVSSAAINASEREQAAPLPRVSLPRLTPLRLPAAPLPSFSGVGARLPRLEPAAGMQLWLPLGIGGALLALLLLHLMPAELLLALAAIAALVALQRRQGRLLPALGWSLGALTGGLLLGSLLLRLLPPALLAAGPVAAVELQSLPALLLLILTAVLIG